MDRRTFLKTGAGAAGLALAAPYVARGAGPMTLRWAHFAQEDHPGEHRRQAVREPRRRAHQRRDQDQHLSQQRAGRAAGAGAADQARHHRHGPADAGPARQIRHGLRGRHAAVHLGGQRARLPRPRRSGHGLARAARREAGVHPAAQLGIRLPQRHQQRAPDQHAGRRQGAQAAHAAGAADPGLAGGGRCDRAGDRLSRNSISRCRRRSSTARRTRSR